MRFGNAWNDFLEAASYQEWHGLFDIRCTIEYPFIYTSHALPRIRLQRCQLHRPPQLTSLRSFLFVDVGSIESEVKT